MIPISVLEVSLALLFFTNKALWIIGKREGWVLGFIAAIPGIYYFFRIELYIFTVLEVGFAVLMWYGFLKRERRSRRVEAIIRITFTVTMGALTYFLFEGLMTVLECVATLLALWGTYFLTRDHVRRGWAILGIGHLVSAFVFSSAGQSFFSDFQIASAIIAVAGVWKGGNSINESSM